MLRVFRALAVLALALGAAAIAPGQTPTPTPAPQSQEERLRQLEQLLADTRAELEIAKIKASSTGGTAAAQLDELSRRIDVLAQEIQNMKMGEAAPAALEAGAKSGEQSVERYGIGPAAAKIYGIKKGVSIGGYGEVLYNNFASKDQRDRKSVV